MPSQPKISFLERDFDTNLQLLKETISQRAPDAWNSFFEGDLGKMLMDLIAYDHAALSYVLDAQAQESFIDTLRLPESLLHFARLTGYNIRRGTAATVEVYAKTQNGAPEDGIIISEGTKVTDLYGQTWETAQRYVIDSGKTTPVTLVQSYGDIKANIYINSVLTEVPAKIKLVVGESTAILVDSQGNRLSSENGFSPVVSQGNILILKGVSLSRSEFGITDVGKFYYDAADRSVLYLDRPWDGSSDYEGKWTIENRGITLRQGETYRETFVAPSSDLINYTISTTFYPVISTKAEEYIVSGYSGLSNSSSEGGVSVLVNNVPWTETPSLLFLDPTSQSFEIEFNHLDQAVVKFGDGVFGKPLPANASVEIIYRVGGGAEGNIPQNSFSASISGTSALRNEGIFLSNPYTVGRGGQSTETLEQAKGNLIKYVRTNDRAVTESDYAYLASNYTSALGRMKLAKAVLHTNTVPREQNIIWVYCWVEGTNGQLAKPTLALKSGLLSYLNLRKMICDEVVIIDGVITNVPLRFFYKYSGTTDDIIKEKVAASLNQRFQGLTPGATLHISQLYEAVELVPEVNYVLFDSPKTSILPTKGSTEMFVNSLQQPNKTTLTATVTSGSTSVVVENSTIFTKGGLITIFQQGKIPTTATISDISGSVITLTPEFYLLSSYTLDAEVINSDFLAIGWKDEKPVDIYIDISTTGTTAYGTRVVTSVATKIKDYLTVSLLPSSSLQKSKIESLVSSTAGVATYAVHFTAKDSTLERVTPASGERIILRNLIINGKTI